MSIIDTIAILISLAALFSYINYRFLKIPNTIGLLAIALLMSLLIVIAGKFGFPVLIDQAKLLLKGIDFNEALMQGMLSALLFAGALHVHLEELGKQKWVVAILARPYVKGRDFWDIWFLREVLGLSASREEIDLRREIYRVTRWERSPLMGKEGWPSEKELIELLDRDLERFLDHEELESLRRGGYGRILKTVESTLRELL